MISIPESVRPLFLFAGWYPGRKVPVSAAIPHDHPATEILAAFGGLTVFQPEGTKGEECGLDDLAFRELAPDQEILEGWGGLLATQLVGVADIHRGHGEWYAAADGRLFGRSNVHDAFWLVGLSFSEAVERSLFGRRVRPLLRPEQYSITLYGVPFTTDSPDIYRYT